MPSALHLAIVAMCPVLLAGVAGAQTPPAAQVPGAVKPEPQKAGPATPLVEITLDLNGDSVMDKATLMAAEDEPAALHLFLGRRSGSGVAFNAPVIKPDLVFNGAMAGQQASLEAGRGGSLRVLSLNEGIGRNKWTQTLTIAFRNGRFVVAGLTYVTYDTLALDDPTSNYTCDVNFLTGRALRNGKPHAGKVSPVTLADFDPADLPKACQ
jgi:hypothetical protein